MIAASASKCCGGRSFLYPSEEHRLELRRFRDRHVRRQQSQDDSDRFMQRLPFGCQEAIAQRCLATVCDWVRHEALCEDRPRIASRKLRQRPLRAGQRATRRGSET